MGHAHQEWLKDASADIDRDYKRLYEKAARSGTTQEVGHQNEAIWQTFLSAWLPPQYEVATRKYIVGTADSDWEPFETDIVVFHPGYPRNLREKTQVMAAGVAAAFSTKLTIRPEGLRESARQCASLQRGLITKCGHSRNELWKPYVFGVLAASHAWKSVGSKPAENIGSWLHTNDLEFAAKPAESLDLACIADLGTWAKTTAFLTDPSTLGENEQIMTSHLEIKDEGLAPLALFLSALYELLSWRNEDMQGMAHDFRVTTHEPSGVGPSRMWPAESILSSEALLNMREVPYSNSNQLDSPIQGMHVHH